MHTFPKSWLLVPDVNLDLGLPAKSLLTSAFCCSVVIVFQEKPDVTNGGPAKAELDT